MTQSYSATHKQWDHTGNVTPNVEVCESQRPAGAFKPADWLPVGRYEKKHEVYLSIAEGKVISLDREGRVVPAGMLDNFTSGGAGLVYDATDYAQAVIDLTTGVALTAAVTYTVAQVQTALCARGLIGAAELAEDFISLPIGITPMDIFQWGGGADPFNPSGYTNHNFLLQHQVVPLCDYVIDMALVPAAESTEIMDTAMDGTAITFGTGGWKNSTGLAATTRYASLVSAGDNIVAYVFEKFPVAKETSRTAISTDAAGELVNEKSTIAEVTARGDFYIDYDVGVLFLYEAGGDGYPGSFALSSTINYYQYEDVPTSVSDYSCAVGDLRPGDFVLADANSNFARARHEMVIGTDLTTSTNVTGEEVKAVLLRRDKIIGQVLEIQEQPQDALERVRTAFTGLTTQEAMPGSATSGYTDSVTFSGAANRVVRINLHTR